MITKQLDIFPWDDNFETGLTTIDEQHEKLVNIINDLATNLAFFPDKINLETIFDELINYTRYHFETEEAIWHKYLDNHATEENHKKTHTEFIDKVQNLVNSQHGKEAQVVAENTLGFLVEWLVSHILESDRYLAYLVISLQEGKSFDKAVMHAEVMMSGYTHQMIHIIKKIYATLADNTLKLMHEVAHEKDLEATIKSNERLLRTIIDEIPLPLVLKDAKGDFLLGNRVVADLYNTNPDDMLGKHDDDFGVPKEIAEGFRKNVLSIMQKGETEIVFEESRDAKTGEMRHYKSIKKPFVNLDGEKQILVLAQDITDLKLKEKQLQIIENIQSEFIAEVDPYEMYNKFRNELLELTGSKIGFIGETHHKEDGSLFLKVYSLSNISWNKETNELHEKYKNKGFIFDKLDSLFGHVITQKEVVISNNPKDDPRGSGFPPGHPDLSSFLGIPIFYGDKLVGEIGLGNKDNGYNESIVALLQPLIKTCGQIIVARQEREAKQKVEEELKKTKSQLEASMERYDKALSASNDGIWDWNVKSGDVYFSANWKTMLGFEDNEIANTFASWETLLHPEDLEYVKGEAYKLSLGNHETYSPEFRMRCKDGSYKWILSRAKVMERDEKGNAVKIYGTHVDLSEQKLLEEKLILAKEEAEKANQFKSEFLANMSHEIRTPMTGILGFVERLSKNEDDPKRMKQFETIRESGHTLLRIINDILDFSKIESGKMELETHPYNLHKLLEYSVSTFSNLASSKNITLTHAIGESLPVEVIGDEVRLKQVIFNLLSNALKFTQSSGDISLVANFDKKKSSLYIAVIDTGIGIAKENMKRISRSFDQEDTSTTRRFGGTGLGLTISSKLIKMMKGYLKVESTIGEGSKFYFTIPLKRSSQKINSDNDVDFIDSSSNNTFHGHALIVEDNKTNQMLLSIILDELGITYHIANDGAEAVIKYKNTQYDLIFMDENMPNMNGIESTKHIRELECDLSKAKTPIIAVTANALNEDRQRFLDAGMDDYVSKPYSEEDILKVLKKYL